MTMTEAVKLLKTWGVALTKNEDGEYRIAKGTGRAAERSAYYTDDLVDAVETARVQWAPITSTGAAAIEAAKNGAPLYVLNPQHGWQLAHKADALARAERMEPHALAIYGVKAAG